MKAQKLAGLLLSYIVLFGCDGGDPAGPGPEPEPEPGAVATAMSIVSGSHQTATVATAVPEQVVVRVVDQNGQPLPGVTVSWATGSGGGALPASSVTNSAGQASATWKLGPGRGRNTAIASVQGAGSIQFEAEAIAFYTVLVYLAADNNLSRFGVIDIEEMELIGSSDSVDVVIQAEFNPYYLSMGGCGTPACINLSSYETFRYRVGPAGSSVLGPDDSVTYIGNRNMTDPGQLAEFIRWAKAEYPSEHYALFLWNHGGGYQGLIEDQTSSPGTLMSLPQLRTALQSAGGGIDMLDFDMCLMGGIETLLSVEGLVDHVAFSEENEPGDGDPYHLILGDLRANPRMSPRDLAGVVVDRYDESYRGGQASATKSAYDMAHFSSLRDAWRLLGTELNTNVASYAPLLSQVIPTAQQYSTPFMRDVGDFLGRLEAAGAGQALAARIDAVQAAMSGSVRIRNRFYTGAGYYSPDVSGSTGLHVVLPSGEAGDAFPSQGPLSLDAYKAAFGGEPWTDFLLNWTATAVARDYFDQGANPLVAAILWNEQLFKSGVDFDFWVLEPNGNIYIPYLGVLTPNGSFDGDSYSTGNWFEVYATRRYVERGRYHFIGELYEAAGYSPELAFLYTTDSGVTWGDLYGDNGDPYPAFSKVAPWSSDPTPTLDEAYAGAYTDLQFVANWDVGGAAANAQAMLADGAETSRFGVGTDAKRPELTPEQTRAIADLLTDPDVQRLRKARRAAAEKTTAAPEQRRLRSWISGRELPAGKR